MPSNINETFVIGPWIMTSPGQCLTNQELHWLTRGGQLHLLHWTWGVFYGRVYRGPARDRGHLFHGLLDTHTNTHSHVHTRTHIHSLRYKHAYTHTLTHTHTHRHAKMPHTSRRIHMPMHTHTHTQSLTDTHTKTCTQTHTHTGTHPPTDTHTHRGEEMFNRIKKYSLYFLGTWWTH